MPAKPEKDGQVARQRLLDYIRRGGFSAGDRLPPERELVSELGLSRAHLRRAFDVLQQSGAVWRHVGKGTFVGDDRASSAQDPLVELGEALTPVRMMQARLCLEPALAYEAAIHASGRAIAALQTPLAQARSATSWATYEAADDRFHRRIAEACDNVLLQALFDQLNGARRTVTWGSIERATKAPPKDHTSFTEHAAIADAIAHRDPDGAWSAMRTHLKSVSARLFP